MPRGMLSGFAHSDLRSLDAEVRLVWSSVPPSINALIGSFSREAGAHSRVASPRPRAHRQRATVPLDPTTSDAMPCFCLPVSSAITRSVTRSFGLPQFSNIVT